MRFCAMAAAAGLLVLGAGDALAQGYGWTSAGTYHYRHPVKTPHTLNKAKQASEVNDAKVKKGSPSGASSGDADTNSGSHASGPHSHPLHGAGSKQWH